MSTIFIVFVLSIAILSANSFAQGVQQDIHFGIVVAVSKRTNDSDFLIFSNTLESVINQTFSGWTLIVVGDGLNFLNKKIVLNCLSRLPIAKWIFQNLPYEETEDYIYQYRKPLMCWTREVQKQNITVFKQSHSKKSYWFVQYLFILLFAII